MSDKSVDASGRSSKDLSPRVNGVGGTSPSLALLAPSGTSVVDDDAVLCGEMGSVRADGGARAGRDAGEARGEFFAGGAAGRLVGAATTALHRRAGRNL